MENDKETLIQILSFTSGMFFALWFSATGRDHPFSNGYQLLIAIGGGFIGVVVIKAFR